MSLLGSTNKEPFDKYDVTINYDDAANEGDTISTSAISAALISDDSNYAAGIVGTTGTVITGTATGGSTTTLIDTSKNFREEGIREGDLLYNQTQKWVAKVRKIKTTTNLNDTLEFDTQASAAANSDTYSFNVLRITIQAGTDGADFRVTAQATMTSGMQFEDEFLVHVTDH